MLSFGAIWFRGVHGRCLLYSFINSVGNLNSVSKLWSCRLANHRFICLVVIGSSFDSEQISKFQMDTFDRFREMDSNKTLNLKFNLKLNVLSYLDYFRTFTYFYLFSSTFRRKKVELLSSLRRHRLGRLSFRLNFRLSVLLESISRNRSKVPRRWRRSDDNSSTFFLRKVELKR
jgi:hypothetical protein